MRHALLWAGLIVAMTGFASSAWADYEEKDVAKLVEAIRQGKKVTEDGKYPADHIQIVHFAVGNFIYSIDVRAQVCFIRQAGTALMRIPCNAIRKGYPLMGPLITWED